MRRPPDRRSARPRPGSDASKTIALGSNEGSDHSVDLLVAQLLPRPVRPDELPELRAIFWRQARLGHRVPAELDVIVIEGGRP